MGIVFLKDAKKWLRDRLLIGATCPCCNRYARKYKTPLNSAMAHVLIQMARHSDPGEWIHVENMLVDIGDKTKGVHGKMKHWGLIRQQLNTGEPGKNKNGYWQLTRDGLDFVAGRLLVKRWVYLYNDTTYGWCAEDDLVSIRDALGKKFNYEELMNGVIIK